MPPEGWLVTAAVVFWLVPAAAIAQTSASSRASDSTLTTQTPPTPQVTPTPTTTPAPESSQWGLIVSVTPQWKIPSYLASVITQQGGVVNVTGSQFTIGVVHGRSESGDWGVSFVREPVKNGSTGDNNNQDCGTAPPACFDTSTAVVTQSVMMTGVEIHKFIAFGLIHGRVQIGFTFAGGIAKISGNFLETKHTISVTFNPQTQQRNVTPVTTVSTTAVADELGFSTVPMMQLGPVVTVIITPALKVYWDAGEMIPGNTFFELRAAYFIGAR